MWAYVIIPPIIGRGDFSCFRYDINNKMNIFMGNSHSVPKVFSGVLMFLLLVSQVSIASAAVAQEGDERVCNPQTNLVTNGSFETPVVVDEAGWGIFDTAASGWGAQWVDEAQEGQPVNAFLEYHGSNFFVSKDGNQLTELDSDWFGPNGSRTTYPASVRIFQDLPTIPGGTYQVTFSFSARPRSGILENRLAFSWNNLLQDTLELDGSENKNTAWSEYSYILPADSATTRLQFADAGNSNTLGTFLDDVKVVCLSAGQGTDLVTDVALTKTISNSNPKVGDSVVYTITVANNTSTTAPGVTVADVLPSGVSFVSASTTVGEYAEGVWTVGDVTSQTPQTLFITATVGQNQAGTVVTNNATTSISNSEEDSIMESNLENNTASASFTVATTTPVDPPAGGGGGGGGSSGGGGGSNAGGGNAVSGVTVGNGPGPSTPAPASAPVGQVLGATTSCGITFDNYMGVGRKNDVAKVKKLQEFLNKELGTNIPITGYFGPLTKNAVDRFQLKYSKEVLVPWLSFGLPNEKTPTGYVYKTTQRWINKILCAELDLPVPQLP